MRSIGLALFATLSLSGCAVAPLVVGLVVDSTAAGVGIYQRQKHQEALDRHTEELKGLRLEVADRQAGEQRWLEVADQQAEELRNLRLEVQRLRDPYGEAARAYQIYRRAERGSL
jgi:hypothetical protein